jgi:glycerol-3-phosphate dehydrogenase (NAD(P)+)
MTRTTVVGGGAWGTALAHTLAVRGTDVTLWARETDVVDHINEIHANPRFLAGATLSPAVRASTVMNEVLRDAEIIVYAAPSHVLRVVARSGAAAVPPHATLVVATKGIERETLALMTDVIAEEVPGRAVVALSGPSFALEVARGQPTARGRIARRRRVRAGTVHAEQRHPPCVHERRRDWRRAGWRAQERDRGATGIAEGLGLGLNSRAALITRGLAEMRRLGVAVGARGETFAGLTGMGDLVLTCTGALSRNRAVGIEIGKGVPLDAVLAGKESVAEGVVTTTSALALAERHDVDMPIVSAVSRVLFGGWPAHDAIAELMGRELRPERDA